MPVTVIAWFKPFLRMSTSSLVTVVLLVIKRLLILQGTSTVVSGMEAI